MSDIEDVAARLVEALTQRGLTLSLAESTTGGLTGSLITDVPGSSMCFLGSVEPYSNDAKEALLGVPKQTMIDHGSVSPETALAMALGARERFGADIHRLACDPLGAQNPAEPVGRIEQRDRRVVPDETTQPVGGGQTRDAATHDGEGEVAAGFHNECTNATNSVRMPGSVAGSTP